MLVITRRANEGVWIGDTFVRIVSNKAGQVRLGIEAPQHIKVLCEELVEENGTTKGKNNGNQRNHGAGNAAA